MSAGDESKTNIVGLQLERAEAVELLRGTVLAGRYQLETVLGRGGAGVVLRAFDRELRETVAIKVLRPELASANRWIERLAREVKLARQIRHPNVCRVFDFEKADGHVFIVMELATRGSLRREVEDGVVQKRPLEARLADARAVAAGLAAIHDAGIAHRDVTPQNVLRMADDRLVVSDFGLATEVSRTTTSIHGGTIAYMAPEVVRGGRASYLSDVWSLGVVIHEIAFGARPAWSKPVGGAVLTPPLGRPLEPGERLALEVCRRCTETSPQRRPSSARAVEQWLQHGRGDRRRAPFILKATFAAACVVAIAGARWRSQRRPLVDRPPTRAPGGLTTIPLTGQPGDWLATSRVLATRADRVRCLALLPDQRTLRYVAGTPPQAEDLDLPTGRQRPSNLVPEAYAEGCPDLSSDGRLLYQGYTSEGRPFAFVSPHPDGSDGEAVVPTADASVSSEPRWLVGGTAFKLEVDERHAGVFSTTTKRLTILPEPNDKNYMSYLLSVAGETVYESAFVANGTGSEIIGTAWPSMNETTHFKFPTPILELASRDGRTLVAIAGADYDVVRVVPSAHEAVRMARFAPATVRYLTAIGNSLAFVRVIQRTDAWAVRPGGRLERLTFDGRTSQVAPCGDGVLTLTRSGTKNIVALIDPSGTPVAELHSSPMTAAIDCGPDRAWFYSEFGATPSLYRCQGKTGCQRIADGIFGAIAVSPDGKRLALLELAHSGLRLRWIRAEGGPPHEIASVEGECRPVWSSDHTIWASSRSHGRPVWEELDVDTGAATGKTLAGARLCFDSLVDPRAPGRPPFMIVEDIRSEIRLQPGVFSSP